MFTKQLDIDETPEKQGPERKRQQNTIRIYTGDVYQNDTFFRR